MASRICRRARLSRAVRLVTHSDIALTVIGKRATPILDKEGLSVGKVRVGKSFSSPQQPVLLKPIFKSQDWRKEWYLYCNDEKVDFSSDYFALWLGRNPIPPIFFNHLLDTYQDIRGIKALNFPYLISKESLPAWKRQQN